MDSLRTDSLMQLDAALAQRFAEIALGHIDREYPHKLDHVLDGDDDALPPRRIHPLFHGSFDWHSCVHGHWLLATLRRLHPQIDAAAEIQTRFEQRFTAQRVAAECAYLQRPSARGFERPYGWAWLLMLQAELLRHQDAAGQRWSRALAPMAQAFVRRFHEYLPKAIYPVRAGVHSNTAFALALAQEYALQCGDADLLDSLGGCGRRWYTGDRQCQAWEPSGDDFLSPALVEAECMRRLLPESEFLAWFDEFLPRAAAGEPETLFQPAKVSDRSDGKIAHLDGLNLSRAWCWRSIAATLPLHHALQSRATAAARHHLDEALPHVAGDYMGEHWLASFALLALR